MHIRILVYSYCFFQNCRMKKILILVFSFVFSVSVIAQSSSSINSLILTKEELQNKIKGGWAGQTIGVTFGGPYEFRFQGTFIGDYQPLVMVRRIPEGNNAE